MTAFYEFITHSQSIIYLLITISGWVVFLYKQSRKPEEKQNAQINEIYDMLSELKETLDAFKTHHIEDIKVSIRMLISREFIRLCMECLKQGYTTEAELESLESIYQEYHVKYGLNGRGEELYHKVLNLEIRSEK